MDRVRARLPVLEYSVRRFFFFLLLVAAGYGAYHHYSKPESFGASRAHPIGRFGKVHAHLLRQGLRESPPAPEAIGELFGSANIGRFTTDVRSAIYRAPGAEDDYVIIVRKKSGKMIALGGRFRSNTSRTGALQGFFRHLWKDVAGGVPVFSKPTDAFGQEATSEMARYSEGMARCTWRKGVPDVGADVEQVICVVRRSMIRPNATGSVTGNH